MTELILGSLTAYGIAGLLFAIAFVSKGVGVVDEAARDSGIGFRIIIIPGTILFWPWLCRKWIAAARKPVSDRQSTSQRSNSGIGVALRRRHLQIWTALLILLPLGIILSWLVVPNQPVMRTDPAMPALLPATIRITDKPDYRLTLRSNDQTTEWQLQWQNKNALSTPSALIYRMTDTSAAADPQKGELIGRIEARGEYLFPIRQDQMNFVVIRLVLYDFIHHKRLDRINL